MTAQLIGASVWEEELYQHLTSHEESERDLLIAYQEAAASSGSAAFRYLASLIVEDEVRHHRLFRELASALKTEAEFRPEQPAVPYLDRWGDDPGHIVELSEHLLEQERADAHELRRLVKDLKDFRHTTMWALLVELMEMDTAKHIAILEFATRHAREAVA
jgi:rubrerythrin